MAEHARPVDESDESGPFSGEWGPLHILETHAILPTVRERMRFSEIGRVHALSEARGTVWSRYGIVAQIENPLPMTWSILRRMMSGLGGYGRLHRRLGFVPDPSLDDVGVADLICGRPYYNLSRVARMYFADFPFVHPVEALRADPRRAYFPIPQMDLRAAPAHVWRRLPGAMWKMLRARRQIERLRRTFARQLAEGVAPMFIAEVRRACAQDLSRVDTVTLLVRLHAWVYRVTDEFASEALMASALAAFSRGQVERRHGPLDSARLLAGVRPRPEADVDSLMIRAARTGWPFQSLLEAIGHRGPDEMELAEPRWREAPERLVAELERRRALPGVECLAPPIEERDEDVRLAREWLSLRESSRHWLMFGWGELRRILLALDRRLRLEGGIFWLELEELGAAVEGRVRKDRAEERRQRHAILKTIECPPVLFSDALDAIGRPC